MHSDLFLLAVIVCCGAIWLAIEHMAAESERRAFISEQAQTVRIAAAALETRLGMPLSQAAIMARYDLGEYFQGQGAIGSIVDHLQASLASYPDVVAYILVDAGGELVYAQGIESGAGDDAINRSLAWVKQFWPDAASKSDAVSTTVLSTAGAQAFIGVLFPVRLWDETVGALIVSVDVHRAAAQVFGASEDRAPVNLFIIESQGALIHQAGGQDAGELLSQVSRENFQDFLARTRGAQAGSAVYSRAEGIAGLLRPRMLVSWQNITLGQRSFIVCRAAPMRR